MKNINKSDVKVVAFDAFDTLVYYNKSNHLGAYGELLEILKSKSRNKQNKTDLKQKAMTSNIGMNLFMNIMETDYHAKLSLAQKNRIHDELLYELDTIRPFVDAIPIIQQLKRAGYKTAVISNLAKPYGDIIKEQLKNIDSFILSYKVGLTKPDEEIFKKLAQEQQVEMKEILMIGNHPNHDHTAPIKYGMQSLLLDRKDQFIQIDDDKRIESLEELADILP